MSYDTVITCAQQITGSMASIPSVPYHTFRPFPGPGRVPRHGGDALPPPPLSDLEEGGEVRSRRGGHARCDTTALWQQVSRKSALTWVGGISTDPPTPPQGLCRHWLTLREHLVPYVRAPLPITFVLFLEVLEMINLQLKIYIV